jgi:hypothetical protein
MPQGAIVSPKLRFPSGLPRGKTLLPHLPSEVQELLLKLVEFLRLADTVWSTGGVLPERTACIAHQAQQLIDPWPELRRIRRPASLNEASGVSAIEVVGAQVVDQVLLECGDVGTRDLANDGRQHSRSIVCWRC